MSEIPPNTVSLYSQDGNLDDFPVLRAFQQYIDAEQTKARKRMLMLGIFFGVMMLVVIAIFVSLLVGVSERNQQLNDRLVEYAMRNQQAVVQPTAVIAQPQSNAGDAAALAALTAKLNEVQAKLKAAEEAAKGPSPEEIEIKRLKALLAAEKEQAAVEKERRRQEELEAYRRKYYPELYEKPVKTPVNKPKAHQGEDVDLENLRPVRYFDKDAASDDEPDVLEPVSPSPITNVVTVVITNTVATESVTDDSAALESSSSDSVTNDAPIKLKGTRSNWRIPQD